MKKILLIAILLFSCISAFSQHNENEKTITDTIPKVNGNYEYMEVVTLDTSYKKEQLYRNAKVFLVDIFKSAKDVIQYDDKEQGKIIGKGILELSDYHIIFTVIDQFTWDVNFTIEISCKDGKYRYRLYDIVINQRIKNDTYNTPSVLTVDDAIANTKKGSFKKVSTRLVNSMLHNFKNDITTLKSYMSKAQVKSKDDF
jgi:hypothetical protein